jgi:MYXO-CTERM domain-containing protein
MRLYGWIGGMLVGVGCLGCARAPEEPAGCQPPQIACQDGTCAACCGPEDCQAGEACHQGGCVLDTLGLACQLRPTDCLPEQSCDPDLFVCREACALDTDCFLAGEPFGDDRLCSEGRCGFQPCASDGACRPGTVCHYGRCVTVLGTCDAPFCCRISPARLVLRPGQTARVFAQPTLEDSGELVPGVGFLWESDGAEVATVAHGLVTAGAQVGRARLTASNPSCDVRCQAEVVNLGPAPADELRVAVVDGRDGGPLPGALVEVEGAGSASADLEGQALFAGVDLTAQAARIRVSAVGMTPLDLLGAGANDLLVTLEPAVLEGTAGFRAPIDMARIPCAVGKTCDIRIGLAGLSLSLNPFGRKPERLFGEGARVRVALGGMEQDWNLLDGMVLGYNQVWFRERAEPTGPTGTRLAWALAFRPSAFDLTTCGGFITSLPGWLPALTFLGGASASGSSSLFEAAPVAWVQDEADRDGDGRTDDLLPDYQALPAWPAGLRASIPTGAELVVHVPPLPSDTRGAFPLDGVLVLALVHVPGAGLVPLGLGGESDTLGCTPMPEDGLVPDVVVRVAEVAGRWPEEAVERLVVAVALGTAGGRTVAVGQVHRVARFEGELGLRPFALPPVIDLDPLARRVQIAGLPPGTDALALLLGAPEERTWQVLAPPAEGALDLPPPPAGLTAVDGVVLAALELADGLGYQDLLAARGASLGALVLGLDGFSLAWSADAGPDCDCGSGGPAGLGWLGLLALAGLARRARRPSSRPSRPTGSVQAAPAVAQPPLPGSRTSKGSQGSPRLPPRSTARTASVNSSGSCSSVAPSVQCRWMRPSSARTSMPGSRPSGAVPAASSTR